VARGPETLQTQALPKNKVGRLTENLEHPKASVRADVEHPFHVIKNLFRHRKTRYRGLAKNTARFLPCSTLPIWCGQAGALRSPNPVIRPDYIKARSTASNQTKTGLNGRPTGSPTSPGKQIDQRLLNGFSARCDRLTQSFFGGDDKCVTF
jgi:hypothetical protein